MKILSNGPQPLHLQPLPTLTSHSVPYSIQHHSLFVSSFRLQLYLCNYSTKVASDGSNQCHGVNVWPFTVLMNQVWY